MKKDLLENISDRTLKLWYKLEEKLGYTKHGLVVNGLGEVQLLAERYQGEVIAKGNRNIQKVLRELLAK